MRTAANAADSRPSESNDDRLVDFRRVYELLGLRCRTGHTARALAARGVIRSVRINARVLRYNEASVRAVVAGKEVAS